MKIQMSNQTCDNCGQLLKQSMVDKKEKHPLCYTCYREKEQYRGHHINSNPRKKRIAAGLPVKTFN